MAKKVVKKKAVKKKVAKKNANKKKTKKNSSKKDYQEKILRTIFFVAGGILILIAAIYIYSQSQIYFDYKGIEFEAIREGDLLFYKTNTLLSSNDKEGAPFGFRLRTNPSYLKKIPFKGEKNFSLKRINGFTFNGNQFHCGGDGVISLPNIQRLFAKIGAQFIHDPNETCDDFGRYNFFSFEYGEETKIEKVGTSCYKVYVKGNEEECEILPATEKIMVEVYSKYKELISS